MFLVIDNYDSFTYNLVQYLGELASEHPIAEEVRVERNDSLTISEIKDLNPDAILLSPGPGDNKIASGFKSLISLILRESLRSTLNSEAIGCSEANSPKY